MQSHSMQDTAKPQMFSQAQTTLDQIISGTQDMDKAQYMQMQSNTKTMQYGGVFPHEIADQADDELNDPRNTHYEMLDHKTR